MYRPMFADPSFTSPRVMGPDCLLYGCVSSTCEQWGHYRHLKCLQLRTTCWPDIVSFGFVALAQYQHLFQTKCPCSALLPCPAPRASCGHCDDICIYCLHVASMSTISSPLVTPLQESVWSTMSLCHQQHWQRHSSIAYPLSPDTWNSLFS